MPPSTSSRPDPSPRIHQVLGSSLARRAGLPRLADVTLRRVRSDFWASLQRNISVMVARTKHDSTRPLHDGSEKARHVFNAMAAFLAAHEDHDRLLDGLAKLGEGAGESMQPDDIEACARAAGRLLAQDSPYLTTALPEDAR